jgi:hypothetical protein
MDESIDRLTRHGVVAGRGKGLSGSPGLVSAGEPVAAGLSALGEQIGEVWVGHAIPPHGNLRIDG